MCWKFYVFMRDPNGVLFSPLLKKFISLRHSVIFLIIDINTREIPGELSPGNVIFSHVKKMLCTEVKRSPLLYMVTWSLKMYLLSVFLYDQNIISSSSEIFGSFWRIFGTVQKSSENRQKSRHKYVYIISRIIRGCL